MFSVRYRYVHIHNNPEQSTIISFAKCLEEKKKDVDREYRWEEDKKLRLKSTCCCWLIQFTVDI